MYLNDVREATGLVDVLYVMSVQQPLYSKAADEAPSCRIDIPCEYVVNRELLQGCNADLMVMHPLPHKGALPDDADAFPQAYYFRQAANAVAVRMALLGLILGRVP